LTYGLSNRSDKEFPAKKARSTIKENRLLAKYEQMPNEMGGEPKRKRFRRASSYL
jgi:hypothetical protein